MTKQAMKPPPLICKFCGTELVYTTGKKFFFPMFRAVDGHETEGLYGMSNDGWCHNRAGAETYHHPDSPEWNGGIDYSDGRARRLEVVV